MALNLKASAQSRNDVSLEGDSDRGGSKGTWTDYGRGVPASELRARCTDEATRPGLCKGPK